MTEPSQACYMYCVLPAGETVALEDVGGVAAGSRVTTLTHGELRALVSEVDLEEFGEQALKRNLEDLGWLERTARAHDAVLARALAADAVVPMRLCTIFANEGRAREMLATEREVLLSALARLRGRSEWSVKVLADHQTIESLAQQRTPRMAEMAAGETESRGRAYFARKRQARTASEAARATVQTAVEDIHARLRERAAAAAVLTPQHPDVSGRRGHMVLNGAYLVDRSQTQAFTALAEASAEQYRPQGLELELSGPWAPYNFVSVAQEPEW